MPPFQIYVLGVMFDILSLQAEQYRQHFILHSHEYLDVPGYSEYFIKLMEVSPSKTMKLVKDSLDYKVVMERRALQELEQYKSELSVAQDELEKARQDIDNCIQVLPIACPG
jgi:hypothetical protein